MKMKELNENLHELGVATYDKKSITFVSQGGFVCVDKAHADGIAAHFGILKEANKRIKELEKQVDNAHNALCAVKESGAVREDDVIDMIERGLDNKEQK